MTSPWIVLVIAVLVIGYLALRRAPVGRAPATYPYERQPSLFTPAERSFLGVLRQALGSDYHVFGKVRLAPSWIEPGQQSTELPAVVFVAFYGALSDFFREYLRRLTGRLMVGPESWTPCCS